MSTTEHEPIANDKDQQKNDETTKKSFCSDPAGCMSNMFYVTTNDQFFFDS